MLKDRIKEYTDTLSQKGLLRSRIVSTEISKEIIRFDSNDYLSLSGDQCINSALQQGYKSYPMGSGGSMLLNGYHEIHRSVENAFADLLTVDECVLFSSGYAANLAVTSLLGQLDTLCLIDKGVHASIYDGLALARVQYKRYLHNDMDNLCSLLKLCSKNKAVITEGIFSMSGQISPLATVYSLCNKYSSEFLVDEAHSFGVIGTGGRGAVDFHGLTQNEVPLRIIALGKAFAAQGALVAGKKDWINALLQAGRSLIYSTAVSPSLSYGLLKTLDKVVSADDRRLKLSRLIEQFRDCIKQSSFNWADSITPIQQLQLGCPHLALYFAQELKKYGFICSVIRQPTVTARTSGLRILINSHHTEEQIKELFNKLAIIDYKNSI